MALTNNQSWTKYIYQQASRKIDPAQLQVVNVDKLLHVNQLAHNVLNHSVPMVYLLDYTTGSYRFVSLHCEAHLNFSYKKLIDGGIDFVIEKYHPADLKLFNAEVFPDRLGLLKSFSPQDHKNLIFSYNYRISNGKGGFINLLQRNSFIHSDDNGNPLLSMGVITNISHFKSEDPAIQLVEKVNSTTGTVELLKKKIYYINEQDKIFSKRELEVLRWLAEGLTSKQIADKLFISEHTVINHKRSMHHKSNTLNTAGLIGFAFKQHLL